MAEYREEADSMGIVRVPSSAYYGSQTQRARDNFPISGLLMPIPLIRALALIKQCAAETNRELGLLASEPAGAIIEAAREVVDGRHDDQFVVDVFQTGSGTSTNMNMNEVIASRANEMLTGKRGGRKPVHPNDHVNLGQSSNDAIPTAIHMAALMEFDRRLIPGLSSLERSLSRKAEAFADIRKIGRTHLQDAVPLTLGQEFSGYARQVALSIKRMQAVSPRLAELALGGTAVGTGINTHPEFARSTIEKISAATGISFSEAENHFEAQGARDAALEASGMLKTAAAGMAKIANDIRWLASGPRCGIGEIILPPLQPGSSIMPGKVNPVIAESVLQAAAQIAGNDTAILIGAQSGSFELNVMMPLIAHNLLESIGLLASSAANFAAKCIDGIEANREACEGYVERSLALVTGFVPHIGYDRASALAKKALESGRTVRQVAREEQVLPDDQIEEILGPEGKKS
ncbi:MAG: class II fumarate hydratase [Desulfobacterales bacterium]|nr:class II fumarate hydratase [Desulfobacterales bacterium]